MFGITRTSLADETNKKKRRREEVRERSQNLWVRTGGTQKDLKENIETGQTVVLRHEAFNNHPL